MVADLWHKSGGQPLRRPVADPLPALLRSWDPGPATGTLAWALTEQRFSWGGVDLPELQRVDELVWSPLEHGHLGLVGTGAGGRDAAVALAVSQLLTGRVESHLYILDATGAFSTASAASRVGRGGWPAGAPPCSQGPAAGRRGSHRAARRARLHARVRRWCWYSAAGAPGFRGSAPGRSRGLKTSSMTSCGTAPGPG